MQFLPTYICPQCKKVMRIQGTQCPHCKKPFTREEVDKMYFVCPTCMSDHIEVVAIDSNGLPNWGATVEKAQYSAIVDFAQLVYNSHHGILFNCKSCASKFNSMNFYLVAELKKDGESLEKKKGNAKIIDILKKFFS